MTVRLRLTLSYAVFLLVSGLAFLGLLIWVLRFVPPDRLPAPGLSAPSRGELLDVLLPRAVEAMVLLGALGLVGGWFLAGRMLRPLDRIYTVAREVSDGSLSSRVRLDGPPDEFQLLADTFDGMLDRLQAIFAEQRRFAANASHELRTPYAISRSILDVAIADPSGRDVDEVLRRLDETNRRGLDVVEALLLLSSAEHAAALVPEAVDLAETTAQVLTDLRPLADRAGVELVGAFGEGDLDGHPTLVRQLAVNLVLNGIIHNVASGGRVVARTTTDDEGRAELRVVNTGPVVAPAEVAGLTEPFARGAGRVAQADGSGMPRGSGLGLSIVTRVASAHGAELRIVPPPTGGLDVRVRFPAPGDLSSAYAKRPTLG